MKLFIACLFGIMSVSCVEAQMLSGPTDTSKFILGFNWGPFGGPGLTASINDFHANVVHTSFPSNTALRDSFNSTGMKLILVYADTIMRGGWTVPGHQLYTYTNDCERMTVYPSAPLDGTDLHKFCFFLDSGTHANHNDLNDNSNSFVALSNDSIATFSNIQFKTNQWYKNPALTVAFIDSTLFVSLQAKLTSLPSDSTDTLFTVTISRAAVGDTTHARIQDTTFAYKQNRFILDSVVTLLDSFPWRLWQTNPYGTPYTDSTDISVKWFGNGAADFYFVRLEDSTAHLYFKIPDSSGPEFVQMLTAVKNAEDFHKSALYRIYAMDEPGVSIAEALARQNFWMQKAADSLPCSQKNSRVRFCIALGADTQRQNGFCVY